MVEFTTGRQEISAASNYYVDATNGDDASSGLTNYRSVKTLGELANRLYGKRIDFDITINLLSDLEETSPVVFDCSIVDGGSITILGKRTQVLSGLGINGFSAFDAATGAKQVFTEDAATDLDGYVGKLAAVTDGYGVNLQSAYLVATNNADGYSAPFYNPSTGLIANPTNSSIFRIYDQTSVEAKLIFDVEGSFIIKDVVLSDTGVMLEIKSGNVEIVTSKLSGGASGSVLVSSAESILSVKGSFIDDTVLSAVKGGSIKLSASAQEGTMAYAEAVGQSSSIEVVLTSVSFGNGTASLVARGGEVTLSAPYGVYDQDIGLEFEPGSFGYLKEVLFGTGIVDVGVGIHSGAKVVYLPTKQPTATAPTKPISLAGTSKAYSDLSDTVGFSTTSLGAGMHPKLAL